MGPKRQDFQVNMWVLKGVIWGVLMLCILELLIPFFRHEEIDFTKVFSVSLPIWMLGGLCFGFNMKRYYRKNS